MPSARYYRQQARTLLSWSKVTNDKAYAVALRLRAANEMDRADEAREQVADLNPILAEFNDRQACKER